MGEIRNSYRSLVAKPEEKRPLEISVSRWEGNSNLIGTSGGLL
jgi:hypothetical protein